MAGARAPDTRHVALARHAYTAIRRDLLHVAVRATLLALGVCCWALAASAPAATRTHTEQPTATFLSSYASSPAPKPRRRQTGCARGASFHSSGGAKHKRVHRRSRRHGGSCRPRVRGRHHGAPRHGSPPASGACVNAQLQPSALNLELIRAATLCLVNRERTTRGEPALRPDGDLQRAAQAHSSDMASSDYFAHDSRNGATPLARILATGYIFSSQIGYAVGENIAWATLWLATPKAIVAGWMASPGHRANILDARFRDTGVGVSPHPVGSLARGQSGAIYTQDFGRIIAP